MTLTYGGGDTPESVVLRYSDVQIFLKRLRKAGYKVRYMVAGEYGSEKGRAHWHIILFFHGNYPDWHTERFKDDARARFHIPEWDHGFCYFQNPDYRGFRYAVKYALKPDKENAVKALSMSKKPPLGHEFFMNLADDLVERRLPLQSPEYAFANVRDSKGRPRRYWLQGRMRELFIDRYYTMWRMQTGREPPWTEFLLEQYLDKIERLRMADDPERFSQDKNRRDAATLAKISSLRSNEFWRQQNERFSLGYLVFPGTTDLVVAYSDQSATLYIGNETWQVTVGNVTVSEQLRRAGLSIRKTRQVLSWLEMQWRNHQDRLLKHSLK